MGVFDSLSHRPSITNGLTVAVIAVTVAFIVHDVRQSQASERTGQTYFTTDDGRTYFPDDPVKLPPYDAGGKPAVRAYVYNCDDGKPFVAYLERYTPEGLQKLGRLEEGMKAPVDREFTIAETTEVKRPGDAEWVKRSSEAGETILNVQCPGGGHGFPRLLLPGD